MIPFRIRITAALLIAALVPLAAFGVLLVITGRADSDGSIFRILLTAFVIDTAPVPLVSVIAPV